MPTYVIGAGLAGLATATWLARAGRSVVLLEAAAAAGGRATSAGGDGFVLNQGPHALQRGGAAWRALQDLGIHPRGARPPLSTWVFDARGRFPLPNTAAGLLDSRLSLGQKASVLAFLARLPLLRPTGALGAWLERQLPDAHARACAAALFRAATYAHAPDLMDASAAATQLRLVLHPGVRYLHGGWSQLVDGLLAQARAAGVELRTGCRVSRIEHDERLRGLVAGGDPLEAEEAVLAVPRPAAARLLGLPPRPAPRAACLDLALTAAPEPHMDLHLGLDRALYVALHDRTAEVAPGGGAVLHVAQYLAPDESPPTRESLEAVADALQPGWRDRVVRARWAPAQLVAGDLPLASDGGLAGRTTSSGIPGLALAGDWVGPHGMLADGCFASARAATASLLAGPTP